MRNQRKLLKAVVINFPTYGVRNETATRLLVKHLGLFPNLSLLYVAATLEREGVDVEFIDMIAEQLSSSMLINRLKASKPDIVAFTVYTTHFHQSVSWADLIKKIFPGVIIIAGGVHVSIFPEETIQYISSIDYVLVGEAEVTIPPFLQALQGKLTLNKVPGLVYRQEGKVIYNGPAQKLENLDTSPMPARHLIDNSRYYSFISYYKNYTVINTSRGCPFKCVFCEQGQTKWRFRSASHVVDEFEDCYRRFGIRNFDIFDSAFTVSKKRVLQICQQVYDRGLRGKVFFEVRSRIDSVDEETLEALAKAGCIRIYYGIESGDTDILENLGKGVSMDRIERIIKITRDLSIQTFGYFILGGPGDTPITANRTIEFAKKLPLDFAIFNPLMAYPKTRLYEQYYLPLKGDFWADYVISREPPVEFMGRPWTEMKDEELRRLCNVALKSFYFRPKTIYRIVRNIKSFEQLKRYFYAGLDYVLNG